MYSSYYECQKRGGLTAQLKTHTIHLFDLTIYLISNYLTYPLYIDEVIDDILDQTARVHKKEERALKSTQVNLCN